MIIRKGLPISKNPNNEIITWYKFGTRLRVLRTQAEGYMVRSEEQSDTFFVDKSSVAKNLDVPFTNGDLNEEFRRKDNNGIELSTESEDDTLLSGFELSLITKKEYEEMQKKRVIR